MVIRENILKKITRFIKPDEWNEWQYIKAETQAQSDYISSSEVMDHCSYNQDYKSHLNKPEIETEIEKGVKRKQELKKLEIYHPVVLALFIISIFITLFITFIDQTHLIDALPFIDWQNNKLYIICVSSTIISPALCGITLRLANRFETLSTARYGQDTKSYFEDRKANKTPKVMKLLKDNFVQTYTRDSSDNYKKIENDFWGIDNNELGLLAGRKGLEVMALKGLPPSDEIFFKRSDIDTTLGEILKENQKPKRIKYLLSLDGIDPDTLYKTSVEAVNWKKNKTFDEFPKQYDLLRNQKHMYDFAMKIVDLHETEKTTIEDNLKPARVAILEVICSLVIDFDLWKRHLTNVSYTKDEEILDELLTSIFKRTSYGSRSTLNQNRSNKKPTLEAVSKFKTGRYRALKTWLDELEK